MKKVILGFLAFVLFSSFSYGYSGYRFGGMYVEDIKGNYPFSIPSKGKQQYHFDMEKISYSMGSYLVPVPRPSSGYMGLIPVGMGEIGHQHAPNLLDYSIYGLGKYQAYIYILCIYDKR